MYKFVEWITQQSTIKAIVVLAGVIGVQLAPDYLTEVLTAVGVVYSGIAAIMDKS